MNDDRLTRTGAAAAVLLVAAIAAVVSFVHIEHLAVTHGQTTLAAILLPVSIDGTVAAASLVMLRAARAGLPTPWLARVMLSASVAATLAANVAYGARYGLAGELLSGWPAVAFVGCAEMAIGMVRRMRPRSAPRRAHPDGMPGAHPDGAGAPASAAALVSGDAPARRRTRKPAAASGDSAAPGRVTDLDAEVHFASDLADGRVPSARQIRRDLHVGQARAAGIRAHLQTVVHPVAVHPD